MEYKNLTAFVLLLILVGMLVGVGVLAQDKFRTASRVSTVVTNESFTVPLLNAEVTLANGNITTFTKVTNSTGSTHDANNYTVDLTAGTLNNTGNASLCVSGSTCYAWYTYDEYSTPAGDALRASGTAVGDVSNTWLSLIVTIAVLAIIITLVITGFGGRSR